MSLKQLVLELTTEARKELRELLDWVEAEEAKLASEVAADVAAKAEEIAKEEAPAPVEAPVAEADPAGEESAPAE